MIECVSFVLFLSSLFIIVENAVISAWNQEYHGNGHIVLLNVIDDLKPRPTYVKTITIAQSSGTGKSKRLAWIASSFPSVYVKIWGKMFSVCDMICQRVDTNSYSTAFPLSDDSARDYLLRAPSANDDACTGYFTNFISSLFQQLHEESMVLLSDTPQPYKSIAEKFHSFFSQKNPEPRANFYQRVVNNAAACGNVRESLSQLEERLKKCCTEWPTTKTFPILISLDEVHVLYERRSLDQDTGEHTLYSRFSSAMSWLVDCNFAVISMSTSSHFPSLAPSQVIAPSMRERNEELFRPAPFTELPFDAHLIANPLVPDKEKLASVGSLEFTSRFGRPL